MSQLSSPSSSAPASATPVIYLVVGPARHGVVRHGAHTAQMIEEIAPGAIRTLAFEDAAAWERWTRTTSDSHDARSALRPSLHLDVTDALFGGTPDQAAALLERLLPPSATLTLHDIPQPAEGQTRFAARSAAYARMVRHVSAVVVASEHEARLLADVVRNDLDAAATPVHIVPLPVPDHRDEEAASAAREDPVRYTAASGLPDSLHGLEHDVVVLGFLYPGKGHTEAIDALAQVRQELGDNATHAPHRVTALGPVASGHEPLVEELAERARAAGIDFRCTGFVADEHFDHALRTSALPVAAHRNVSASGSLASWMSVGRRAVVPHGTYVAEQERLRPGTLAVQAADAPSFTDALMAGMREAITNPGSTWFADHVTLRPGPADCAAMLLDVWKSVRQ